MSDITNIKSFKEVKKLKRYLGDITKILHILSTAQKALSFFKHYITAQETISVMETNKTLLELHKKRYEKELAKITGEYPDEDKGKPKV